MIEGNKSELASVMTALGKLICRTFPLALCQSIKIEASEGKLRLSTCGLNEEVSFGWAETVFIPKTAISRAGLPWWPPTKPAAAKGPLPTHPGRFICGMRRRVIFSTPTGMFPLTVRRISYRKPS